MLAQVVTLLSVVLPHAPRVLFQVLVPVPDYTAKCTILVTTGKAKYDATKKAIVSANCFHTCCHAAL